MLIGSGHAHRMRNLRGQTPRQPLQGAGRVRPARRSFAPLDGARAVAAERAASAVAGGVDNGGGNGDRSHTTDYVVIGSGIGGLCCAGMLARYGYSVTVVESHYLAGGAAHSFDVKSKSGGVYKFDAGPSFHMGLADGHDGAAAAAAAAGSTTTANPLRQVLDLLGERVECARYSQWVLHAPGLAPFPVVADRAAYIAAVEAAAGPRAAAEFRALEDAMRPLQRGAALFPAAAIRPDLGVALTAARFLGPEMLGLALVAGQLTGPFSAVVDRAVTDPWLRSLIDLECFVLSGMTAKDTLAAEMAFMFSERANGRGCIDYPMGGSAGIVDALVRGLTKHGGRLLLRAHADEVLVEGGRAVGVALRPRGRGQAGGDVAIEAGADSSSSSRSSSSATSSSGGGGRPEVIRARMGVVSNASVWDTAKLLPQGAVPAEWRAKCEATPMTGSFMHLHLGIDAAGLPADLDCHHLFVRDWDDLEAPQNVRIASIPTVFDPSLAPPGRAVVHAYTAGNEPYALWQGLRRGSPEYEALKEERAACLWEALERVIPDIRARAEVTLVGTPLTHERFLRRHRGTYGPAISARGGAGWPGPNTPLPGLYRCGDSCMPGIGVPAAAASGLMAANALAPVWSHLGALNELNL